MLDLLKVENMEFPNLGRQCSFAECQQLDFLFLTCPLCSKNFCKEHFPGEKHNCVVKAKCIEQILSDPKVYICKHETCSTSSPFPMECSYCKQHFCLEHRYHGCTEKDTDEQRRKLQKFTNAKQQFQVAKEQASKEIEAALKRAKKNPSLNKTAQKIILMKLKGNAIGVTFIPVSDRIYFSVLMPDAYKCTNKAIFVSKRWSIGRAIDSICELCTIINKNHEPTADKLRLFHEENGEMVCSEMDKILEELINEGILYDGETLKLEYVKK